MGLFGSSDDDDSGRKVAGFEKSEKVNKNKAMRVIDEEAEVVIYAISSTVPEGYGLTAIPLEDTALTVDNEKEQ